MSARRLSRGRGAVGRPACAHARILALAAGSCKLFCCGKGVCLFGRFPFWCGGEGTQNYLMPADPSPPYQSARKSSGKLPKAKDYRPKAVLHNARYRAFICRAFSRERGGYLLGDFRGVFGNRTEKSTGVLFATTLQVLFYSTIVRLFLSY